MRLRPVLRAAPLAAAVLGALLSPAGTIAATAIALPAAPPAAAGSCAGAPASAGAGPAAGDALAAAGGAALSPTATPPEAGTDALTRRTLAELADFTGWLAANRVAGYVGEVGWPKETAVGTDDAAAWNALADAWFARADRAGLWVTVWVTTENDGPYHPLAPYESVAVGEPVSRANSQAPVLARHPSTAGYLRGVDYAGGDSGFPQIEPESPLSNADVGTMTYGRDYDYGSQASYGCLAAQGVKLIRLPFRWERLQPTLGGPLDATGTALLRAAIGRIHAAGLGVVVDMHNFGGYYLRDPTDGRGARQPLGSPAVPVADFVDFWTRMATALRGTPGLVGYDLMNEPVGLAATAGLDPHQVWDRATQAAVLAIRAAGDTSSVVAVESCCNWDYAGSWSRDEPVPWIADPAGRLRYEAHQYWDVGHSSQYRQRYSRDDAAAAGF